MEYDAPKSAPTSSAHRVIAPRAKSGRSRKRSDSGIALAWSALLMIPMLGFVALAIDVGAWYTQATKIQAAADAGALAGVVWLPKLDTATAVVEESLAKQGIDLTETFEHSSLGSIARWDLEVQRVSGNASQLHVILVDRNAPVYFGTLFVQDVEIARQSIGEFIEPIPFGSRDNELGVQCNAKGSTGNNVCDGEVQGGFSLQAFGPTNQHGSGDGLLSRCLFDSYDELTDTCGTDNPNYLEYGVGGHSFAIDVKNPNSWITVQIFDAHHVHRDPDKDDGLPWDALAHPTDDRGPITTKFTLYEADGSKLTDPMDTPVTGCTEIYEDDPVGLTWSTLCTFYAVHADVYPLRVQTSGFIGADATAEGWNAYALRAFVGYPTGPSGQTYDKTVLNQPNVYALAYLPIESHITSQVFDLTNVGPQYAGKTLSLKLFDPGDGKGNINMSIKGPTDYYPSGIAQDCARRDWKDPDLPGPMGSVVVGDCTLPTTIDLGGGTYDRPYNDTWLEFHVRLPDDYSCTDCWWSIDFRTDGGASAKFNELTLWSVSIVGDPVRLAS